MDKYGLLGFPLKHSFSKQFFTDKFKKENIDAAYLNFEIPSISMLPEILDSIPDLKGLNVTIPYKEKVLEFLDELDQVAAEVGAVNVIKVYRLGDKIKLKGYNSDIAGFRDSIAPCINGNGNNKALILGTGGASKAVEYGLKELGVNTTFVSRTPKSGRMIYSDLSADVMKEYNIIVNSTPVGTFPNIDEAPEIPYELLTSDHLLYDLVYNPEKTKFLREGEKYGAKTKNGSEMLEIQALKAWDFWNS